MDRSITSLNKTKPDTEAGSRKQAGEFVPPILSEEQAAGVWRLRPFVKTVTDVNRLAILQELSQVDGLGVLELSDRLMLSQPLTSWHLHILKRARLVTPTRQGRRRIYRLDRERLNEYRELFQWVTSF